MKLSVIIATHNRPGALRVALAALARQTLDRSAFEVIVVDDGSEEEDRLKVRGLQPQFNFHLLEKERGGQASARNLGADHATGDFLHFLDDDVEPVEDALNQMLQSHAAEPGPVAVLGAYPFADEVKRDTLVWYLDASGYYDLFAKPRKYPGGVPPLPPMHGNSSVSREVFFRVGKYDETFREYGGEDMELGYRMVKAGVRVVYNPRAIGRHHVRKDFARHCRDQELTGQSLARIFRKHPEIKAPKKIDVVADSMASLPFKKKLVRAVMLATMACPVTLAPARWTIRLFGRFYLLRGPLFPLYRWVSHYHYAVGLKKGLAEQECDDAPS